MPRHTQPREVAELKGAVKHDPQRYQNEVPKVERELGLSPVHMSAAGRALWFEMESYAPTGVIRGADRFMLEIASELMAEFREDARAFSAQKYAHLIGTLGRLGFSPSDRQKLGAVKPKDTNPFDTF